MKKRQEHRGADRIRITAGRAWNTCGRSLPEVGSDGAKLLPVEEEMWRHAAK